MTPTPMEHSGTATPLAQLPEKGRPCFAVMFGRWLDTNEWTYNQLAQAAKSLIGASWIHPSQVSALRSAKLEGPNPKVFAAIYEVNAAIVRWKEAGTRPSGVPASFYESAEIWRDDNNQPLTLEKILQLFLGYWEPVAYKPLLVPPAEAGGVSKAIGRLVRTVMATKSQDLIEGWDDFIRCYAPVDITRRTHMQKVVLGLESYTPEELAVELPVLVETLTTYTGIEWTATLLAERLGLAPQPPQ